MSRVQGEFWPYSPGVLWGLSSPLVLAEKSIARITNAARSLPSSPCLRSLGALVDMTIGSIEYSKDHAEGIRGSAAMKIHPEVLSLLSWVALKITETGGYGNRAQQSLQTVASLDDAG